MNTVDLIIKNAIIFYKHLKNDKNGRYRSWEYSYSEFFNTRGKYLDSKYDVL